MGKMKPPVLTETCTTGSYRIELYGRRCKTGWTITRINPDGSIFPCGHRPTKDQARTLALDAAHETPATYLIKPRR
jgi:hypothetical protein